MKKNKGKMGKIIDFMVSKQVMKDFKLKSLAIFMIMLILTLPFYISSVYADSAEASIVTVEAKGKAGLNGFTSSSDDYIEVTAVINYLGEKFSEKRVKFFFNGFQENPTCTIMDDGNWKCIKKLLSYTSTAGVIKYYVEVYDSAGLDLDKTNEKEIIVDGFAPTATITTKIDAAKQIVKIKYTVKDEACKDAACFNKCSGFKYVKLLLNDAVVEETTTFDSPSACEFVNEIEKPYSELSITEGMALNFCVEAEDKVGLKKKTCEKGSDDTTVISTTAPMFDETSFRVLMNGLPFAYLKSAGDTAKLTFIINATDDNALRKSSFKADFTQLSPLKTVQYKNKAPDKVNTLKEEDITFYEATWDNIELKNPESEAPVVTITATDNIGNVATFEASVGIKYDVTPPSVSAIFTDYEDFLNASAENNIYVEFAESESGLTKENVFLDLNALNGKTKVMPNECISDAGRYLCIWENIDVTTSPNMVYDDEKLRKFGHVPVQVHVDTKDNVGNYVDKADEGLKTVLKYDKNAPVIVSALVNPADAGQSVISTSPDEIITLVVTIKEEASEITPEYAYADFTDTGVAEGYVGASECAETEVTGVFECYWDFAGISEAGTYSFDILVYDKAGNYATKKSNSFAVLELVEDATIDNIADEISVESESILNRNFLFMSTTTYHSFTLPLVRKKTSYVHDFHLTDCTATADNSSKEVVVGIVTESLTGKIDANKGITAKDYLLNIGQFAPADLNKSTSIVIKCNGDVVQSRKKNNKLYKPNEAFTVIVTIPLGNTVFENPGEKALDKAFQYSSAIDILQKIIDILNWIVKILKFCQIIQLIIQIKNNVCIIIDSLAILSVGVPVVYKEVDGWGYDCSIGSKWLTKLWYGYETPPADPKGIQKWNNKELTSLGFWCDLVLCSSCAALWDDLVGSPDFLSSISPDKLLSSALGNDPKAAVAAVDGKDNPAGIDKGVGKPDLSVDDPKEFYFGSEMKLPWDPHRNVWVALICFPPCLPTIVNTLDVVKRILVAQNVCMNKAYLVGGNVEECGSVGWKIFCMLTFGQFISMIPALIKMFVTKMLTSLVNLAFEEGCKAELQDYSPTTRMTCSASKVKMALIAITEILDLITNVKQAYNMLADMFDFGSDSDDTEAVEEEFDAKAEYYGQQST